MTLYGVVLFVHVGAALLLAAALGIDAIILYGLRQAAGADATRLGLGLGLWGAVPRLAGIAGLLLLMSGLYLTKQMAAWNLAWPMVALAALILIGAFGGVATRRMRTLRNAFAAGRLKHAEISARFQDVLLRISISLRIMLVVAALALMTMKPGLSGSLAITAGAVTLGFLLVLPLSPKGARFGPSHPSDAGAAAAHS